MRFVAFVAFALVAYPSITAAQELTRRARLTLDNDYFVFWLPPAQRHDDNYTQGARLSLDVPYVPQLGRRLVCRQRRACGTTLEIGQEIYTPTFDAPTPLPGERPYAGWLYARVAARAGDGQSFRSLELTTGVTGPPSLAEAAQKVLHRMVPGFRTPQGWEYQLPTEAAIAIRWAQAWRLTLPGLSRDMLDFVPAADATLGTLRTAISGAGRIRVGTALAHPWLRSRPPSRIALQGFVGLRGEAITRDLFLDGTTFRPSVRVDPEPLVLAWERGVGISSGRFSVEYHAVTRGREYRSGPQTHTYGSVIASWALR